MSEWTEQVQPKTKPLMYFCRFAAARVWRLNVWWFKGTSVGHALSDSGWYVSRWTHTCQISADVSDCSLECLCCRSYRFLSWQLISSSTFSVGDVSVARDVSRYDVERCSAVVLTASFLLVSIHGGLIWWYLKLTVVFQFCRGVLLCFCKVIVLEMI